MTLPALYVIIGDPVAQARSPEVFNALFTQRQVNARMVALHVKAKDFEAALQRLATIQNFAGAVITIPHKAAAARIAVHRSPRVETTGVANVLKPGPAGWMTDLFDGEGFVAGLRACGYAAALDRAAVVGAGGAGMAIAAALLDAGVLHVAIHDIDPDRTQAALRRLAHTYGARVQGCIPSRADQLVVNATPLGMAPDDDLPFDLDVLSRDAIVADVIMKPPHTRLLVEASRRGHPVQAGKAMLDGQAEAIWRFFMADTAHAGPRAVFPKTSTGD